MTSSLTRVSIDPAQSLMREWGGGRGRQTGRQTHRQTADRQRVEGQRDTQRGNRRRDRQMDRPTRVKRDGGGGGRDSVILFKSQPWTAYQGLALIVKSKIKTDPHFKIETLYVWSYNKRQTLPSPTSNQVWISTLRLFPTYKKHYSPFNRKHSKASFKSIKMGGGGEGRGEVRATLNLIPS